MLLCAGSLRTDGEVGDLHAALLELGLEPARNGGDEANAPDATGGNVGREVVAVEVNLVGDVGADDEGRRCRPWRRWRA